MLHRQGMLPSVSEDVCDDGAVEEAACCWLHAGDSQHCSSVAYNACLSSELTSFVLSSGPGSVYVYLTVLYLSCLPSHQGWLQASLGTLGWSIAWTLSLLA